MQRSRALHFGTKRMGEVNWFLLGWNTDFQDNPVRKICPNQKEFINFFIISSTSVSRLLADELYAIIKILSV